MVKHEAAKKGVAEANIPSKPGTRAKADENDVSEPTLYRKYRPALLHDVRGQDHIVTVLRNALASGKVAHAYLFAGPRGTGKTTIARILSKRLNCEHPNGEDACGKCARCVAAVANASLDIVEIDAASNRGIDEIRALKERIRLAPTAGKYKIYIVDEVHMLTKEAFNALLKTLEEPPAHAIFVLATTELQKVPDTIRSRCQTFLFRRAPVPLLEERLRTIAKAEGMTIEDDALLLIAQHSDGCFRDAESLLGQIAGVSRDTITAADTALLLGIAGFEVIQSFVERLLERDARAALETIHDIERRGVLLARFADDATRYLRALASVAAAGIHSEAFAPTVEEGLRRQAARAGTEHSVRLLRLFLRAKTEMRDTDDAELPLALAILEWCGEHSAGTPPGGNRAVREPARPQARATRAAAAAPEPAREQENAALFGKVTAAWPTFLERSVRLNPLLLSTLQACIPSTVRGKTLYLVTKYSLYQDRMSDDAVRRALEDLLAEIVGASVLLRTVLERDAVGLGLPEGQQIATPTPAHAPATNAGTITDALSIFGGELVGKS
jgi:DNA polymerase III subunit gamma/tau